MVEPLKPPTEEVRKATGEANAFLKEIFEGDNDRRDTLKSWAKEDSRSATPQVEPMKDAPLEVHMHRLLVKLAQEKVAGISTSASAIADAIETGKIDIPKKKYTKEAQ